VIVRFADWRDDAEMLSGVRHKVFVQEQGVPEDIETDGRDADCYHALALADWETPVGVARMDEQGHIGRVAVLPEWRGRGVGTRLVQFLILFATFEGIQRVEVNSQIDVCEFYQRLGFAAAGEVFEEAGILHVPMSLNLAKIPAEAAV